MLSNVNTKRKKESGEEEVVVIEGLRSLCYNREIRNPGYTLFGQD
jgi:hypothetical protein